MLHNSGGIFVKPVSVAVWTDGNPGCDNRFAPFANLEVRRIRNDLLRTAGAFSKVGNVFFAHEDGNFTFRMADAQGIFLLSGMWKGCTASVAPEATARRQGILAIDHG